MLISLQNMRINVFLKLEGERDMENRDNLKEKEDRGLAMEMLGELKEQLKRCHRIILILIGVVVAAVAGFLLYLNQYDFESTIEQNGVYTLIDSQRNVISSDITPDQIESIMEIINNGEYQNDAEKK